MDNGRLGAGVDGVGTLRLFITHSNQDNAVTLVFL